MKAFITHTHTAQEEDTPYEFFVQEEAVRGTLDETLGRVSGREMEKTLEIVYQPQARFKVQAVTRCSSSIPGTHRKWVWQACKCLTVTELYPQWTLQYYIAQWTTFYFTLSI